MNDPDEKKKRKTTITTTKKKTEHLVVVVDTQKQDDNDDCDDDCDDADDDDDEQRSIQSQDEALLEMLGLDSLTIPMNDDCEVVASLTCVGDDDFDMKVPSSSPPPSSSSSSSSGDGRQRRRRRRIIVPSNNHRFFYPPEDCWAYQFPNLLSIEECQELIHLASSTSSTSSSSSPSSPFQYVTQAFHTTPDGQRLPVQLQNPNRHKLSVFAHLPSVERIWERLQDALHLVLDGSSSSSSSSSSSNHPHHHSQQPQPEPPLLDSFLIREDIGPPCGINPRLRVLRYDSKDDDDFIPHFDATTRFGDDQISLLTVLIYLNSGNGIDFMGGETSFWDASNLSKQTFTDIIPQVGTVVIFEHDLYHSGQKLHWGTKYVLRTDLLFEMSQEKWEQRGLRQRQPSSPQGRDSSSRTTLQLDESQPSNDNDNDDDVVVTIPTTILELIRSMEGWDETDQLSVMEILEDIGMVDASIETFCSPGYATIQSMILDTLPVSSSSSSSSSSKATDRMTLLIDRAFECSRNPKKH